MVAALLAERTCGPGVRFKAHRSGNDIAEGSLAGMPVTLATNGTVREARGLTSST